MIPAGVAGFTVLADFSGTPYCGTPTWTDITDWVATGPDDSPVQITWGRQDWDEQVSPSDMSLTLDNGDGRFTPGNATLTDGTPNPYYPNVRRRVRIRAQASVGGITVYLFDGFVDDWDAQFVNGVYGMADVEATDILGRMGADSPLRGFLTEEVMTDSPAFFYPLQEADGATSFGDLTGGVPAVIGNSKYGAGVVAAGQSVTGLSNTTVVQLTNPNSASPTAAGSWLSLPLLPISRSLPVTYEFWAVVPADPPAAVYGLLSTYGLTVSAASGGTTSISVATTSALMNISHPAKVNDGNAHHFVVVIDTSRITYYVDDSPVVTTIASTALADLGRSATTLGMHVSTEPPSAIDGVSAGYAYVAMYPTALSAARVLSHYQAGTASFAGDTTAARVARLLTYRRNLGSVLDSDTVGVVGSADCSGDDLSTELLGTGTAEGGILYIDGQGRVNLRSRARLFNPAPVAIFDCAQGQITTGTAFVESIQNFVNDVTCTRPNGAAMRAFNQASIDQDGEAAGNDPQPNVLTDQQALDMASWRVAVGVADQIGGTPVVVDLKTEPSTAVVLAALQIAPLNAVTVENLPPGSPVTDLSAVVQGGEITFGVEDFEVSWNTEPIPPQVMAWDSTATGNTWDGTAGWSY